jgi:asparagine synthase (glutamine-hydrolysing)
VCGIAGVYNLRGDPVPVDLLKRMTDIIAHRGPDGEGHYAVGPIGLGHRRLAVIDLTPSGAQPMTNETGDMVITYNGEIYNFLDLRAELEKLGHRFRSRTDSEVALHAYEQWGKSCAEHFNGMFAFAIWDGNKKRLFLARDRYGIKPLYWYSGQGHFIFASEIKAILQHPAVCVSVCYPALSEYFAFQNIFSDLTLFEGIRLLPAGCTLTMQHGASEPKINRYWDHSGCDSPLALPDQEVADRLYDLFVQAVSRQMVSDVPVGSYLSGGMDSGSITAVAVRQVPRLTTFTGGFDLTSVSGLELGFDERQSAEMLANLFKTEHYEVVLHAGDMEWVLPRLIWHLEDLRVGQSYPNYYVARLAGRFVKVVLSGVGGDELFGGYPWRYYRGVNSNGREDYFRRYFEFWQRLVPEDEKPRLFNAETQRHIGDHAPFDVFRGVFADWPDSFSKQEDYIRASLYFELKTFLHGILLVEDKLSMAHSLESRVPFLDNDIVDFANRIPIWQKLTNLDRAFPMDENQPGKRLLYEIQTNEGKSVLRKAMSRLVPQEVTARNKQGFSAPDATWFRGESINYINRLLRDRQAIINEFIAPDYIAEVLDQHCSGQVNRRLLIWSMLSFEWWCRTFLQGRSSDLGYSQPAAHKRAGLVGND